MIIPDINLLLYAYDSSSTFHSQAARWWQNCLSQNERVGLLPVVIFGFVRIATNTRAFVNSMAVGEAVEVVRSWLQQPAVELLEPPANHIESVLKLLETLGTAGNLVTDAQIAAAAIDQQAVVHTSDTDFLRFPAVQWFNPITGLSSSNLRRRKSS